MKAVWLRPPGNLEALRMEDMADPGDPGPGAIRVRLHASSLNFHDLLVVSGRMAPATPLGEGRIPMSDGAGMVEAVGDGVTEFAVGDAVISLIFPQWQDGGAAVASFSARPGTASTATPARRSSRPRPGSPGRPAATAMPRRPPWSLPGSPPGGRWSLTAA